MKNFSYICIRNKAYDNDKIDIKLKCLDGSILPIASFVFQKGKNRH